MSQFQVLKRRQVVSAAMVEKFRPLPVANVSDCMARLTAGGANLRPYHNGTKLCGAAITVKTRPGDNLMIYAAINIAKAGDVIVVDGGGELTNALVGEIMLSYAKTKGIAGFVLNAAIRDTAWIAAQDMPVYAAGVTHRGPYRDGVGEVNGQISIGGMVVNAGDLVIGDEDGFHCVPYEECESVYQATLKKNEAEAKALKEIAEGKADRTWVEKLLKEKGCVFEA
jgi:regulator of RNase E activity RraA